MSIREQENELFKEWRAYLHAQGQPFIPDGVVNEVEWEATPLKVLFLLKEANNDVDKNGHEEEWDEREYLQTYATVGSKSTTVNNLATWIDGGVLNTQPSDWQSVLERTASFTAKAKLMEKICLVNVKKVPGRTNVEASTFDAYWKHEENRHFLRRQLDLYQPDIVVCCATTGWYQQAYPEKRWQTSMTSRGINYFRNGKTLVLDFYHPAARIKNLILHYALYDAMQELRLQLG